MIEFSLRPVEQRIETDVVPCPKRIDRRAELLDLKADARLLGDGVEDSR